MAVLRLKASEIGEVISFNQQVYPHRKKIAERCQWQILDNPWLLDKENTTVLISRGEDHKIQGQFSLNSLRWHFQGKAYAGFFGTDYYMQSRKGDLEEDKAKASWLQINAHSKASEGALLAL